MENTIENKAKFFAQYWGQNVMCFGNGLNHQPITANNMWGKGINDQKEDAYLTLTPLSKTTDEDAISAIMISLNSTPDKFEGKQGEAIEFYKTSISFDSSESDYLRSKGYALPYMGLSVEKQIEYGWVKLK